jgi:catechol 2,3-dioxygenase-like lactoylglutathione lyase family enzyme
MKLGAFSVSLNVKDIKVSQQFYEDLGFTRFFGDPEENWIIMKNESTTIGLFQGMLESNMMTFNPGWDANAEELEQYDDVRDIQKILKTKGRTILSQADESASGPASFTIKDPDGNIILIDQHIG